MSHLILKGVLAGLIGLTLYNTYCIFKPEIVTYDKQKIVGLFVEQLSHVKLDDQRLKEKTFLFSQSLQQSLRAYCEKHHVVALNQNEVGRGVDITNTLIKDISDSMRGKP